MEVVKIVYLVRLLDRVDSEAAETAAPDAERRNTQKPKWR